MNTQSFTELPLWVGASARTFLIQVTIKVSKPHRPANSLRTLQCFTQKCSKESAELMKVVTWSVQCYCQWVSGPGFALWVLSVLMRGEWNLDCFLPIRMDLSATSWHPLISTYFQTPPEQSLPTLIIWIFQVKYAFGLTAQVITNAIFSYSVNMNLCPLGNTANTLLFGCEKEQTGASSCWQWPTRGLQNTAGNRIVANSQI